MKLYRRSFEEIANELVTIVPERSDELDFTEASLVVVEEMLSQAAANLDEIPEIDQHRMKEGFGCYILEVARRTFGGRYAWLDETSEPVLVTGEPHASIAIAAWSKVAGRLSGDEGDNIPFHFQGFAERARAAKPGDEVVFV